jgi:hypothetical protein
MGSHINKDGQFQSDKYPTTPAGKVPLSVKDLDAQALLWRYAQLHHGIDPEFSNDLFAALRAAGYDPEGAKRECGACQNYRYGQCVAQPPAVVVVEDRDGQLVKRSTWPEVDAAARCGWFFRRPAEIAPEIE